MALTDSKTAIDRLERQALNVDQIIALAAAEAFIALAENVAKQTDAYLQGQEVYQKEVAGD